MKTKPTLVIPGITDPITLTCISRARKYKQYCRAVKNALEHLCPFCNIDRDYNKIELEGNYWIAFPSNPPENHTKIHLLIVPKRHVKGVADLSRSEWNELRTMLKKLQIKNDIKGSGILIRDGDATLSAGTIQHLHIHMMVPNGKRRVAPPFCKGMASERQSLARAIIFEKMRTGTPITSLEPQEQKLIKDRL